MRYRLFCTPELLQRYLSPESHDFFQKWIILQRASRCHISFTMRGPLNRRIVRTRIAATYVIHALVCSLVDHISSTRLRLGATWMSETGRQTAECYCRPQKTRLNWADPMISYYLVSCVSCQLVKRLNKTTHWKRNGDHA